MKYVALTGVAAALLILAGCEKPAQTLHIDCGKTDIIVDENVAAAIRADATGTNPEVAVAACDLVKGIDTSSYTTPVDTKVTTSSGKEYTVQLMKSAN